MVEVPLGYVARLPLARGYDVDAWSLPFFQPRLMPFKSPYLWFEALHGHPFWREQWEQYIAGPFAPFFAFAMKEKAAAAFLDTLTGLIRSGERGCPRPSTC